MLTQDTSTQFEALKTGVLEQIRAAFPVQDRLNQYEVRLKSLEAKDTDQGNEIEAQLNRRLAGRTWSVPIQAHIEIVKDGKVIAEKKLDVASVPRTTRHGTYIVAGQEKTITNQWRLRPGVYVKATEKADEYEAQVQLAKGRAFDIRLDDSNALYMAAGTRKVPLHSVLKALGTTDSDMEKAWGPEIYKATVKKSKYDKDLTSLHDAWAKKAITGDLTESTRALFEGTHMDAEIARANTGVHTNKVTGELLFATSKKLLDVGAKRVAPDPIDSLRYKELWTTHDHIIERLSKSKDEVARKMQQVLGKKTVRDQLARGDAKAIRDIVAPDLFQKPIYHVFSTALANVGKQTNPVAMMSDRTMATITGPGGIQNDNAITASNTAIDPSHLGYLDPVFTPESDPGKTTHLTFGAVIKDRKPGIRLYNTRTHSIEQVDAARAATSVVVLPDQVRWEKGQPIPVKPAVRVSDAVGKMRDTAFRDADYVMLSPTQVFSTETNLVPFMQNDSAGRTSMSARHMAQAISIVHREAPLVQVGVGDSTFEKLIGGSFLAHTAPVDGTVTSVSPTGMKIKGADGKERTVGLYSHYPTNHDKGQLHSTPLVKVGDKVKAHQVVADHNHSKDGVLALGTNLRVAYLANGANHEDGIVLSESAAAKLRSEHLHKPGLIVGPRIDVGRSRFLAAKPGLYKQEQLHNIGDDGMIKPGTVVRPGDPIVLALGEGRELGAGYGTDAKRMGNRLMNKSSNASLLWDAPYSGTVVRVAKVGKEIQVHVKTEEPAQVGSKVSTRHSAKGIVSQVLPDNQMPRDGKGKPVEVLLNPVGVPGRNNPGQILETVAGKIAEKTGKPYIAHNFVPGVDYLAKLRGELRKHGISETEALFDPKTGRKLGDITVGPHYLFQLEHQIDKKTHYRGAGPAVPGTGAPTIHYDGQTKIPQGGGHHGAQSLGALGVYGALAAGLHDNLQEMQTLKSDQAQSHAVWDALTNGKILPAPQVPYAYRKFEAMLKGLGVGFHDDGTKVRMLPTSDREVRAKSNGQLRRASMLIRGISDAPVAGGLFDTGITGGMEGKGWSHIELPEAFPHPVFAEAIQKTLGLKRGQMELILEGKEQLNGLSGPKAIHTALKKLDRDTELAKARQELKAPSLRATELNKVHFKVKALEALRAANLQPHDGWTITAVPVLPPVYRPIGTGADGKILVNPLNKLYRRMASSIQELDKAKDQPYGATLDTRHGIYKELGGLLGTVPKSKKALDVDTRGNDVEGKTLSGILHMISGESPKDGYFQDKLIGKKQDFTARATIISDPQLGVDQMGVPSKIALEMMRPILVGKLVTQGYDRMRAERMITDKHPAALAAARHDLETRPLLVKRDPVLHQYGLLAQNVHLTEDPAIRVNPLILPAIGGDVDGDTVALMVPLSRKSVDEAKRALPSARPLAEASGDSLFTPTNEASLALYRMTIPRGTKHTTPFADAAAAEKAFYANKLNLNTPIHITGTGETTLGRVRVAATLPEKYRAQILTGGRAFDKNMQSHMMKEIAKETPGQFAGVVDKVMHTGFQMAYESGHTVTLHDLEPLRAPRNALIQRGEREVAKMRAAGKSEADVTQHWLGVTKKMHELYEAAHHKNPNNVSDMAYGKIKAKKEQFQGLVMAPMLVEDHLGRPSAFPVSKSFAEGVDVGGYFMQAAGARRGTIQKTESVREPGYMSKLLVQSNIDQRISGADCGATGGVLLNVKDKDIVDRFLAQPLTIKDRQYAAGSPVTPEMTFAAAANKVDKILVRSPLKCQMPQGVCSKCMGVHPNGHTYQHGENVGIVAAQALGERAAQIMLKQTHGGGIVSLEPTVSDFGHVQRLFDMVKPQRADAAVAPSATKVHKVTHTAGGMWEIHLEGHKNPLKTTQRPLDHVKPGYTPAQGEVLSAGEPAPHAIAASRGLEGLQAHMVKRVGDIYAREGVLRRHAELAVRAATSTVRITDAGDHHGYIRGDYAYKPLLDGINKQDASKRPIKYETHLTGIGEIPARRQPDWMARLQSEDLARSVMVAAQHGHTSDTFGPHPIPRLAAGRTTNPLVGR